MQGLVTKYYKKHGRKPYGFIEGYDGEKYYFNGKMILTDVHEGDEVKFKATFSDRGNVARDVQALFCTKEREGYENV